MGAGSADYAFVLARYFFLAKKTDTACVTMTDIRKCPNVSSYIFRDIKSERRVPFLYGNSCKVVTKYGTEEYGQDSPRYTSPKAGLYGESYYMDGNPDPWSSGNNLPTSSYTYTTPMMASGTHLPQTPSAYSNMHLPPESMGYHTMSPSHDPNMMPTSLPPVSSFRGPGTPSVAHLSASPLYGNTNPSPTINSTEPLLSRTNQPSSQTGDALGKALASIYSTDHTSSSFSSNPSTPVSSPPPLSGASQWSHPAPQGGPSSPHFADGRLHSLPNSLDARLDNALNILCDSNETRMEERLDDAINVLRNHAEGPPLHGPHSAVLGVPHSNGLIGSMSSGYPNQSSITTLDSHLTGPHSLADRSQDNASANASQPSFNLTGQMGDQHSDTDGDIKLQRLSRKRKTDDDEKVCGPDSVGAVPVTTSAVSTTTTTTSSSQHKGNKRSRSRYLSSSLLSSSADEDESPELKAEREKERRQANNARERIRVRDINEAFKELGRMCVMHLKTDKAQTKLNILHQAVEVITNLEQQVRERNLNPKAACLKRREEEKNEEGPKLGPHALPHPASMNPLASQHLATTLSVS
uniref:BHLH domain-containing protein n=1 Tax=Strigamia maritima TaxID=126957 RepID=T1J4I7_STRMM